MSGDIYTLGIWKAKPGKEALFIDAWTAFATWTSEHMTGCGKAFLLRDLKDASRFISFGPWNNEHSIGQWRSSEAFHEFHSFGFVPRTSAQVSTYK